MRLLDMTLKNIGPFDEAHLEFLPEGDDVTPVAVITGENGTGKTILLDAIRGLFGSHYTSIERQIWRDDVPFHAKMTLQPEGEPLVLSSRNHYPNSTGLEPDNRSLWEVPIQTERRPSLCPRWVVDFWRSALPNDGYEIAAMKPQQHPQFLRDSLKGIQRNAAVTELITAFDYLRGSDDAEEKRDGEALYEVMRKIVSLSVLDGELSHVDRRRFMPMIRQSGQVVPLSNLSSGNAYLIQHLIGLLGKMYAVHALCKTDAADICTTPGLLLIDEAENHLHPRWQKRFLKDVRTLFPNVQIVATTHSPFIVGSVLGARVFVCSYDKQKDTCIVEDASTAYADKPIEEILLSPAFGTPPFGEDISRLMEERKAAIDQGASEERERIETQLKERNPEYFSFLDIEKRLEAMRGSRP